MKSPSKKPRTSDCSPPWAKPPVCSAVTTTNKNSPMAAPDADQMQKCSPAPVKVVLQMVHIQCFQWEQSMRQCGFGADVCLDENVHVLKNKNFIL